MDEGDEDSAFDIATVKGHVLKVRVQATRLRTRGLRRGVLSSSSF